MFFDRIWMLFFISTTAAAQSFGFGDTILRELEGVSLQSKSSFDLSILAKQQESFKLSSSSVQLAMRQLLAERGLNPLVALKPVETRDLSGLSLSGIAGPGIWTDFRYHFAGYPVCGVSIRSIEHPSGEVVVVGSIPQIERGMTPQESDWPDLNDTARKVIQSISETQGLSASTARVNQVERCLFNEQGQLEPAWDFVISMDEYQFSAQSNDHRVFAAAPRYFDAVNATVQAYSPNIEFGTLTNFTISTNGDQTLSNPFFVTEVASGSPRVTSSTHTFLYNGATTASSEASAFAYANQHLDFVTSKGYVWQGPKPMAVKVYASIRGNSNNALYTPASGTSAPNIQVGEGDGVLLKNLAFDSDVVSHELGHHVIYQSVTVIAGESLVIHEGLADFITFARTGDDCLGESICPEGTQMRSCQLTSNRCLRSANNTLVYNDATYASFASQPHLQGQLISGWLWDIRKAATIPADTLTSLVLQALTYLPSDASISNLVAAVLYADSVNGATYQSAIIAAANARGLDVATLKIDLANLQSSLKSQAPPAKEPESKKNFLGCAAIAGQHGQEDSRSSNSGMLWLMVALLPILVVQVRAPLLARVRSRRRP